MKTLSEVIVWLEEACGVTDIKGKDVREVRFGVGDVTIVSYRRNETGHFYLEPDGETVATFERVIPYGQKTGVQ